MVSNQKVLAIIPARGGSKGIPGKNIKPICGKPLVGWPILAAQKSKYVDDIIVSTDSHEIADVAKRFNINVPFIRPDELSQDDSSSISVVNHALEFFKKNNQIYDFVLLLEPTSPLTESSDIDTALEQLINAQPKASAIVGVTRVESSHPDFCVSVNEDGFITPFARKWQVLRRQEIEILYHFEGSLYISTVKSLEENQSFYHDQTIPYLVPKWKAFEIDDLTDFFCVEAIMNNLDLFKKS